MAAADITETHQTVVTVAVTSASNVKIGDVTSSDPYCRVTVGSHHDQTKHINKTLNPTWDETLQFVIPAGTPLPEDIVFEVFDYDKIGKDDSLGVARIPFASLAAGTMHQFPSLPIDTQGTLNVSVTMDRTLNEEHSHEFLGLLQLTLTPIEGAAPAVAVVKFGAEAFHLVCKGVSPPSSEEAHWCDETHLWVDTATQRYRAVVSAFHTPALAKADIIEGQQLVSIETLLDGGIHEVPLILLVGQDLRQDKELSQGDLFHAAKVNNIRHNLLAKFLHKREVLARLWAEVGAAFDTDGTGTVDALKFTSMLATVSQNVSDEEAQEVFSKIDVGCTDNVTFDQIGEYAATHGMGVKFSRCPVTGQDLSQMTEERALNTIAANLAQKRGSAGGLGDAFLFAPSYTTKSTAAGEAPSSVYDIAVQDRLTGLIVQEHIPTYIKTGIRMLYRTKIGRASAHTDKVKNMLTKMTVKAGVAKDKPSSKSEILAFVREHNLALSELRDPVESYNTFNEFFYRKLKPEVRPIASPDDPRVVVSPADCRLNAFDTLPDAMNIWIKGTNFSLPNLVQEDSELFNKFRSGSIMIARLAPQDYHRVHLPIDCTVVRMKDITGTFYTVSPFAVKTNVDVYTENRRCLVELHSDVFGTVLMVMVGATMVGSIRVTVQVGQSYRKGDELGYFAFGGSTVLLLFENGAVAFDRDLVENSKKPIETLVKMGMAIGIKTAQPVSESATVVIAPTTTAHPAVVIESAVYTDGGLIRKRSINVREQLQAIIDRDGSIQWPIGYDFNKIAGDPHPGKKKELKVAFTVDGDHRSVVAHEGQGLHIP